jgi:hypothetical protein
MNEVIDILKLVLKHHSDYTDTYSVDDVDMVLEFKFVLKAFGEFCRINEVSENERIKLIDELYNYRRDDYRKLYVEGFDESEDVTDEEKKKEALDYFDYVFENEKHPDD